MVGWILLAAFIGIPLAEIAIFIEVGGAIGVWATVALVVATAILGTTLLRIQGLATLARARAQFEAQTMPVRELFDGACLLFAGALLLTPGFITDAVGFLLLVPPLRETLRRRIWAAMQRRGAVHVDAHVEGHVMGGVHPDEPGRSPPIIDAEYQEIDETDPPADDTPWGRPHGDR